MNRFDIKHIVEQVVTTTNDEQLIEETTRLAYFDNNVEISEQEFNARIAVVAEHERRIARLLDEKIAILRWFKEHDYYINKVVLGEWLATDERYIAYISERAVKRARLDAIELELQANG